MLSLQHNVARLRNGSRSVQAQQFANVCECCCRHILNFLVVLPSGPEFLDAIDTSGDSCNAQYIKQLFGQHIQRLEDEGLDVVQVRTRLLMHKHASQHAVLNGMLNTCQSQCR